jgi:MoxR-like ATPase
VTELLGTDSPVRLDSLEELRDRALSEISKAVLGNEKQIELLLIGALCRGHVLLEGPPGTAKTLLSAAIGRILGVHFNRVQFTPDTTPTDILGRITTRQGEAHFERGAVFTNVLLADEINRTPPRTQAALLEAMQERRVTLAGRAYWLDMPFFVVATQNPYEHEGVYPLPESQLDRFMFKVDLNYPTEAQETAMLDLPHQGVSPDLIGEITPLLGQKRFLAVQEQIDQTEVPADVARYLARIVRHTRELPGVELGASPRATIHLMGASKAAARMAGRETVTHEDVRGMVPYVLSHRLLLDDMSVADALRAAVQAA